MQFLSLYLPSSIPIVKHATNTRRYLCSELSKDDPHLVTSPIGRKRKCCGSESRGVKLHEVVSDCVKNYRVFEMSTECRHRPISQYHISSPNPSHTSGLWNKDINESLACKLSIMEKIGQDDDTW